MKIVIDARMYGLEHAGIGRYVMSLVNHLERLDKKNDYWLLLRKKYFEQLEFRNRRFKKILADYRHYSFLEQLFLPLQLIKLKPDLVHFPHFNVPVFWWGKQVVTIHDLIKHESRGPKTTTKWRPFYWFKYLNYCFLVWLAVKRASQIIVPSQHWKEELIKRYKVKPSKIVVTYEGADSKFKSSGLKKSPQTVLKKYHVKKPFVIYTGSLYPHKNIVRLARAVKKINAFQPLTLVVVCARNIFYERFKKKMSQIKATPWVNLAGFVPDEELALLYQEAEAFVFPTLLEGFGLPGLEAMAANLPLLASDIPVLREVYGKGALFFDPYDINDISQKILTVVGRDKIKKTLVKQGNQQLKKYSWQKMAQETLTIYLQIGRQ